MSISDSFLKEFDQATKDAHDAVKAFMDKQLTAGVVRLSIKQLVPLTESLMTFLAKDSTAAAVEDNIQRVFRARNSLNNFKNNCDGNYSFPDVHQAVTKFCSSVQAGRAADGKKTTTTAAKTTSTKRAAPSESTKKGKRGKTEKSPVIVEDSETADETQSQGKSSTAMAVDDEGTAGSIVVPEAPTTAANVTDSIQGGILFETPQVVLPFSPPRPHSAPNFGSTQAENRPSTVCLPYYLVPGMDTKSRAYIRAAKVIAAGTGTQEGTYGPLPQLSKSVASELRELSDAATAMHQHHMTACNHLVLQQHLLNVDHSLITATRELEDRVRQYIFYTQQQERLLQLLRSSST
ncbi:hypothetical protein Agabi119p4_7084 [Agaricus bisporus var. burnettii]|uniref:Uncharacterized protein n=1 Tax=Agaricus bisporus var. burnettii TaxID=192524 RepID=A0A8H7C4G1_AGABI|nr:hypothetical protein Agabi119p4_8970 [Agaricus bisporus var. burnettii]KAF7771110.1 hypothetical protein Agabi119p4_7084 [Agaricus bisporus var. burnettii]